jgi:hypothetical protein
MSIRGRCVIPHTVMAPGRDSCEGDSVAIHVPERACRNSSHVHATCANVVGKVIVGHDNPPLLTIPLGKEFRAAATACQQVPDRSQNKDHQRARRFHWRARVVTALPLCGAFASVVGHLNHAPRLPLCPPPVSWYRQAGQSEKRR